MLNQLLFEWTEKLDKTLSRGYVETLGESAGLVGLLFHHLFADRSELDQNVLDPQQGLTVDDFRVIIDYFLQRKYQFVTPTELCQPLHSNGRYLLLSFDDGYFNNARAIPVLEQFGVPAVFCISTGHVQENKSFWWDVLYRAGKRAGKSVEEIHADGGQFKGWKHDRVDAELKRRHGKTAHRPASDLDRPFTPAELRDFANHPKVHLGNHTVHHAILPHYTPEEIAGELTGCQDALREMTGKTPALIAYPSGDYNETVTRVTGQMGLRVGVTTEARKNLLSSLADDEARLKLGRHSPHAGPDLRQQLEYFRSDLMLTDRLRKLKRKITG